MNSLPLTLAKYYPIHPPRFIQHLQVLGFSLISASILYLIAANWFMLPQILQLSIAPFFLLISATLSIYFDKNSALNQTFQGIAGLMIGLSLAVIGQVYQTGADSYQLFLVWAILLLPWLYRPQIGIFSLFSVVSLLALTLFFEQTYWITSHDNWFVIAVNIWTALLFIACLKFYPALRWIFLIWIGIISIGSMINFLIRSDFNPIIFISSLLLPICCLAYFRFKKQDLLSSFSLIIIGLSLTFLIMYGITRNHQISIISLLFISAIIIFAWFWALALLLKKLFPQSQFNILPLAIGAWISGILLASALMVAWEEVSFIFALIALIVAILYLKNTEQLFARQFFYCLLLCGQTAFLGHFYLFIENPIGLLISQLIIFIVLTQCKLHWFFMFLQFMALYFIAVFNIQEFTQFSFKNPVIPVAFTLLNFAIFSLMFVVPYLKQIDHQRIIFLSILSIFALSIWVEPITQFGLSWEVLCAGLWSVACLILIIKPQSNLLIQIGFLIFSIVLIACQFFEILPLLLILPWCLKQKDKLIYALSLMSLIVFLWLLYYSLDLSFLIKSLTIFISGITVLFFAFLLSQNKIKIEGESP